MAEFPTPLPQLHQISRLIRLGLHTANV